MVASALVLHVGRSERGQWQVVRVVYRLDGSESHRNIVGEHANQQEATEAAQRAVAESGGGEIFIFDANDNLEVHEAIPDA